MNPPAFPHESPTQFRDWLVDRLRHHEPSAGPPLGLTTLEGMVEVGIARAQRAGFEQPAAIVGFVVVMFTLSPNFDEHPALRQVLQDSSLTELQRIERIADSPRALRVEVASQSRLSVWFEED